MGFEVRGPAVEGSRGVALAAAVEVEGVEELVWDGMKGSRGVVVFDVVTKRFGDSCTGQIGGGGPGAEGALYGWCAGCPRVAL